VGDREVETATCAGCYTERTGLPASAHQQVGISACTGRFTTWTPIYQHIHVLPIYTVFRKNTSSYFLSYFHVWCV